MQCNLDSRQSGRKGDFSLALLTGQVVAMGRMDG